MKVVYVYEFIVHRGKYFDSKKVNENLSQTFLLPVYV